MIILIYRLSVFGKFKLEVNSENIDKWHQALQATSHVEYVPYIIQQTQQIPSGVVAQNPELAIGGNLPSGESFVEFRSRLINSCIRILSGRVDIEFVNFKTSDYKEFFQHRLEVAIEHMQCMLESLGGIKGNRCAYFTDVVLSEGEYKGIRDFCSNNNLGISLESSENEFGIWSHKFNRRINLNLDNRSELCNAIFSLEKGILQWKESRAESPIDIKGLRFLADINTLADRTAERFTTNDFKAYFSGAQDLYLKVLNQMENFIIK